RVDDATLARGELADTALAGGWVGLCHVLKYLRRMGAEAAWAAPAPAMKEPILRGPRVTRTSASSTPRRRRFRLAVSRYAAWVWAHRAWPATRPGRTPDSAAARSRRRYWPVRRPAACAP